MNELSERIMFRVSAADSDRIRAAAAAAYINQGQWLRAVVLSHLDEVTPLTSLLVKTGSS